MKNWIPITNEYLIDNFSSLLDSLAEADFSNSTDEVMIESIARLEEVAKDLLKNYFSHKLGILNDKDDLFIRNIRIVLAAVYALHKIGKSPEETIVGLFDTLVVNKIYTNETSLRQIKSIVVNLAAEREIETVPFNLKDLATDKFDLQIFRRQLLGFIFRKEGKEKVGYDSKGSCVFDRGDIRINTVGLSESTDSRIKPIADLSLDVKILADEKKKIGDLEFKDQVVELNRILQSLAEEKPKPVKTLKSYSEDQEFFVKVTGLDHHVFIKCMTIDPAYQKLELYLDLLKYLTINQHVSLTREAFLNTVKPGQILKVRLINKNGRPYFSLNQTLKEGYFEHPEYFDGEYEAIFIEEFKGGTRWLTHLGHIVNIKNNDWDTEIFEAASEESGKGIVVANLTAAIDNSQNPVINGSRVGDVFEGIARLECLREIPFNLIEAVLDYWTKECPEFKPAEEKITEMSGCYVETLSHILAILSEDLTINFYERYYDAFGARLLARMLDNHHDETYCKLTLAFLRALWAFAQDTGHQWLSVSSIPSQMAGIESLARRNEIVGVLSRYKTGHLFTPFTQTNEVDIDRLEKLVEASNALSGNIVTSEINKIKHTITRCLGIESIYTEEASDKYWFGEENEMMEFKTSIVHAPIRNGEETANPDIQIWQIIKTVNGFLNSLHGGTLLLGVNDFGNVNGLEDDIQWLFANHRIITPEIDKYKLYIKERVDRAFQAFKRKDSDTDITSTRVNYKLLPPIEGKTVLRIEILPFEYGCVKMKDVITLPSKTEITRPPYIKEAYVRSSNTTEELTNIKREKIEADKRKVIKDTEQQKYIAIQEAIEASRYVELKKYQSYRGESDKVVEPVELLPLRGLLVGVQKDEKKLKVFKLSRCEEVLILDNTFRRSQRSYSVDPFNMLAVGGNSVEAKVRFDRLGWLLVKEMFPYTDTPEYLKKDNADSEFPYLLTCRISDVKGIGSFCLSVLGHFRIQDTPALEEYISGRILEYEKNE